MFPRVAAVLLSLSACASRPAGSSDAGDPHAALELDAGVTPDAGAVTDAGAAVDAGPRDAGPCASCPHGTWCLRDTCIPECAPCDTDADCADGASCDRHGCVFFAAGCSGPAVESVRILASSPWSSWSLVDTYELDVPTGRFGATLERSTADGGTQLRDGGVVFIDAGAWPAAAAWCPYVEAPQEGCGFDMPGLHVEVSGGGQLNAFDYYTGASHLPPLHPLLMDLFWQAAHADAGR